jgi:hypothetical protein
MSDLKEKLEKPAAPSDDIARAKLEQLEKLWGHMTVVSKDAHGPLVVTIRSWEDLWTWERQTREGKKSIFKLTKRERVPL